MTEPMIRHDETETEPGDDGADQLLGLPQRQAEHRFQRQRRRDRQARVAWLAASPGPRLRFPRHDCRAGEPDRQAAALPQGGIVGVRVRGPVPLLGNVVAALGIGFGRHNNPPRTVTDNGPDTILPYPTRLGSMQHGHSKGDPA